MPAPTRPNFKFNSSFLFDAIIIGAGPAGLSAALALSRVKRTAAVFSSGEFRNDKAHRAHSILSRDHQPASEIRRIGREQIDAYGTVHFVQQAVAKTKKSDKNDTFEVEDETGETWQGRKILLATGSKDIFPDIDGYADCWGASIWQCLFCDGIERSDRPAGILGFPNAMYLHYVSTIFQFGCPTLTIFANGPLKAVDEDTALAIDIAKARGAQVDEREIKKLEHLEDGEGINVVFEDGSKTKIGFLAHKPPTEVTSRNLAKDLGLEIVADGMDGTIVKRLEPFGATNVEGVYIAGDAGVVMKHSTVALAQGTAAGAGINMAIAEAEIAELKRRLPPVKVVTDLEA